MSYRDPLSDVNANMGEGQQVPGSRQKPADEAKQKGQQAAGQAKQKGQQVADQAKDKGQEVAGQAQEKGQQVAGQAQEKVDQGIDTTASGLSQAAGMLRSKGEEQGGSMATTATKAAEKLDGASQYLQGKDSAQLLDDLEALARRKPVESLLVAAGLGFVLSKVFR